MSEEAKAWDATLVAMHDPDVPNWLDTAGHRRGALALRFVGADATPTPLTRLTKVADA